jgi:hypothetical protein
MALPFAVGFIALTLSGFARIIRAQLAIEYDVWFELGMVTGQIAFQWLVLWRRSWAERLDYALLVTSVSTFGAILLWPLLLWNARRPVESLPAIAYFFAVVGLMFVSHVMLLEWRKLPPALSASWVGYRLLILLVAVRW